MKIKYFPDTDTLYVAFTDRDIADTVDFNADTLLDALLITPLAARPSERILVDLPRSEAPPDGFRPG